MSTTPNEVEALLLDSLRQLQAEFEQREKRLTDQYAQCMKALEQQSKAFEERFQILTRQYKDTMELNSRIDERLRKLMPHLERL
jgi:septal ring factor EnvC (AmiA/AmiB activator)